MDLSGEKLARKMGRAYKGLKAGPCLEYSSNTKRSGGWSKQRGRYVEDDASWAGVRGLRECDHIGHCTTL